MAGEKRSNNSDEVLLAETTILLDVEGTTTSISFVKEKLFPYVRNNLKKYLDENWDQEEFKTDLEKLKEQANKDEKEKVAGFLPISGTSPEEEKESLLKNILWQMDADRKTGALKQLQGHMWRQAFESGDIKGHVFDDVPKALESWTNGGRKVYIYSSGSVESQKLLFSHSQDKDLTKFLSGYFDTEVGAKNEVDSYKNILNKLNIPASSVLFLTDIVKEAESAKEAGMSATIVIREGNAPLSEADSSAFSTIKSFDELSFQSLSKRQKVEPAEDKKESKVEEVAKSEPAEKTESNDKSQVDGKTEKENADEPMDTSEDISVEIEKKTEAAVTEKNETKDVVEAEQCEEKKPVTEVSKDEIPKIAAEDSKESTNTESVKSKDESVKEEAKKDEEMIVDEPDKAVKPQEVEVTEKSVDEIVKQDVIEEKSEISASKAEDSQKTNSTPEDKIEEKTEPKPETTAEVSENSKEVVEEKVQDSEVKEPSSEAKETPTETKETPVETKEEVSEKTPEIVVEKEAEVEADVAKTEVKENGGVAKAEEKEETVKKTETEKAQPELRSEKPEEEKVEKKDEVPEKSKDEDKATEVDKTKEEENKVNGTSNGEEKHSNGVGEKEKSESNTSKATSSQNGEAEADESSEAIKVKKVVDSTVADGAGEPEVVTPPVAVAATS
ncbi:enolase-phosphatase E1-like [Leptopilina boulardi]|uniref:enolase-phosphatase E1-like n=1 Tax=Leptopilina boulardi TaxID=63433 RepID=UPI0021F5EB21|nr:enolase-phosphatase E1-like [Leptopilina boulardi]